MRMLILASDTSDLVGITGSLVAVVVAALVAGDGICNACVLFALRSFNDPDVAGVRAQSVRSAHGPHCPGSGRRIAVLLAAPFINVLAVLGGEPMACRLRCRRRHGRGGDRSSPGADYFFCSVSSGPNARGWSRRSWRRSSAPLSSSACRSPRYFPPAACPVLPPCNRIGCWRMRPIRAARSGGRRTPYLATIAHSPRVATLGIAVLGTFDRALLAQIRGTRRGGGRRLRRDRAPSPLVALAFVVARRPACCGIRGGRCSCAIRG